MGKKVPNFTFNTKTMSNKTTVPECLPECFYSMLTSAVFELVQQFYYATEIGNAANAVSACADQT